MSTKPTPAEQSILDEWDAQPSPPSLPKFLPPMRLVDDDEIPAEELPSADALNAEQITDAVNRTFENTKGYPRFPWPELDDIAGLMCPEDLIVVAGRTGNGKSLFLTNLFDNLVCNGYRALYIGLEQSPKILRVKWACMREGIVPKFILAPKPEERATTQWEVAKDAVCEQLKWQKTPEIKQRAHFSSARFVDRDGLTKWTQWAADMGCEIVIVDHVDRMRHGDGKNSFHELSETIRLAKELAEQHRLTMLLASQVGRPADALQKFMPPSLSEMRGAGTKEEEADTALAVYRPLKSGITAKDLTLVRQGLKEEQSVYEPNAMAVRVLKHRLDGEVFGKQCVLDVQRGRLKSRPLTGFGGRVDV